MILYLVALIKYFFFPLSIPSSYTYAIHAQAFRTYEYEYVRKCRLQEEEMCLCHAAIATIPTCCCCSSSLRLTQL